MSLKIYNSAHDNQEHLPMLIEANLGFSERKNLIKVDMSNVELACLIKLGYNALE